MTPTHMIERRDALADKHLHHARRLSPNENDIFCDGFSAACAELVPVIRELREALAMTTGVVEIVGENHEMTATLKIARAVLAKYPHPTEEG